MLKMVTYKPIFWISFFATAIGLTFFTFHYFSRAFPIIHLSITMNREEALSKAKQLSYSFTTGPEQYIQAASFDSDNKVQTFVELEAGGKPAFTQMMEKHLYEPYVWHVRHFKEYTVNETSFYFTPEGKPYGFHEKISEEFIGTSLSAQEAQQKAEDFAEKNWNLNLSVYKLVEPSSKTTPHGRVDHLFVYERVDEKIGEGSYRLSLKVSGDKITKIRHFVKIPEAFSRRYQEMRSYNNSLAWAANLLMMLLYFIGGCIIALFILLHKKMILWKQPLLWGMVTAGLLSLMHLNQLPLLLMYYNTAHGMHGFLLRELVKVLYLFLYQSIFFSLIFAAAESLTRKAFGNHIQLWQASSLDVASSTAMLGRTIGGYLLVAIDFALVVIFYLITTNYFGWWMPSSALFDPNILATYVPWFSPLANAFEAGFVEECLFRAIPLSLAALLGKRYGKQNWWIGSIFILQAFIFGAAHANYPAQPFYARLVELIIPSFTFGGIFIVFGLIPSIISHIIYDVVWMALPLFVSNAPGTLIQKAIVIIISTLPVWIVLHARWKKGYWNLLPERYRNKAWQIPTTKNSEPVNTDCIQNKVPLSRNIISGERKGLIIALIVCSISLMRYQKDSPDITIDRTQAETYAKEIMNKKYFPLNDSWKVVSNIFADYHSNKEQTIQNRFVWQHSDQSLYHNLLHKTYLNPPCWIVRFAQFEGDIINRKEEFRIYLNNDGTAFRTQHIVPESQTGASLTEQEARSVALETVRNRYDLSLQHIQEISAVAKQHPHRKDWIFSFFVPEDFSNNKGQARITIIISGNIVTDSYRSIHVPEEWKRTEINKDHLMDTITMICYLILFIIFLFGSLSALTHWHMYEISYKTFGLLFFLFFMLFVVDTVNMWPAIMFELNTSEPLYNQIFQIISGMILQLLLRSGCFALTLYLVSKWKSLSVFIFDYYLYTIGYGMGIILIAMEWAAIQPIFRYIPHTMRDPLDWREKWEILEPLWAKYEALSKLSPILYIIINGLKQYCILTLLLLLFFIILNSITKQYTHKKVLAILFCIELGAVFQAMTTTNDLVNWIVTSILLGMLLLVFYRTIIRFDHTLVILAAASYLSVTCIRQMIFNAFPGAFIGYGITIILLIGISSIWFKKIHS